MGMNKRQAAKFGKILAQIAQQNGAAEEEIKEKYRINDIYTSEDRAYETQSVLNFYAARVEPFLGKKETPEDFDKRYREWRIKVCPACGEEFAYAFSYDGVRTCSLECVEKELEKIGIIYSRHHDLKRRWGYQAHPAIVPSSALKALKVLYPDVPQEVFSPDSSDLPIPHVPYVESQNSNKSNEQDSQNNTPVAT